MADSELFKAGIELAYMANDFGNEMVEQALGSFDLLESHREREERLSRAAAQLAVPGSVLAFDKEAEADSLKALALAGAQLSYFKALCEAADNLFTSDAKRRIAHLSELDSRLVPVIVRVGRP